MSRRRGALLLSVPGREAAVGTYLRTTYYAVAARSLALARACAHLRATPPTSLSLAPPAGLLPPPPLPLSLSSFSLPRRPKYGSSSPAGAREAERTALLCFLGGLGGICLEDRASPVKLGRIAVFVCGRREGGGAEAAGR